MAVMTVKRRRSEFCVILHEIHLGKIGFDPAEASVDMTSNSKHSNSDTAQRPSFLRQQLCGSLNVLDGPLVGKAHLFSLLS